MKKVLVGLSLATVIAISGAYAANEVAFDERGAYEVLNKAFKKLIKDYKTLSAEVKALKAEVKSLKELRAVQEEHLKKTMQDKVVKKEENAQTVHSQEYVVTSWTLNLRNLPTHKDSKVVALRYMGNVINVEEVLDNGWAKSIEGQYFNTKFAQKISKTTLETLTHANIRSKPIGGEESFVRKVEKGTQLHSIAHLGNWYVLDNNNFIFNGYVKTIK
jgi:cell division protein FtsB